MVIACYDEFAHQPLNLACFSPLNSRWPRNTLTWTIVSFAPGIPESDQLAAAERAFSAWASASALELTRADDPGGADLVISFSIRGHGDDFPFDGEGHVLGHAYFPGSTRPGEVHIDADGVLAVTPADGEFELYSVLLHEIGHALGLEHSTDDDAVMAPRYHVRSDGSLTDIDVQAIRDLYGSKDLTVPPLPTLPIGECGAPPENLTAVDPDTDEDGIPDTVEIFVFGTAFDRSDTDGDGVEDFKEVFEDGTSPIVAATPDDPDEDGDALPLSLETQFGTSPTSADTDGEGLSDGEEVFRFGTDPLKPDTDDDGLDDRNDPFPTNPNFGGETQPPQLLDCNDNDIPDVDDIAAGTSADCNENSVPDECDIAEGASCDANGNGRPDDCERGNLCADGDTCTMDEVQDCVCVHLPRADCDDGVFCNGVEGCADGECAPGTPPCAPNERCDEETDACVVASGGGGGGGGGGCQNDAGCSGATPFCVGGACVACRTAEDCDDKDPCTTDACVSNVCSSAAVVCDDGLFCNGPETCDPAVGCVSSQNPCGQLNCNEGTDECGECFSDAQCDDGLFCNGEEGCDSVCFLREPPCNSGEICNEQTDTCTPRCTTNAQCSNGLFCDGVETCNFASGLCVPGANPCAPGQPCDEGAGECVASLNFTVGTDNLFGTAGPDAFAAPLAVNPAGGNLIPTLQTGDAANALGAGDSLAATFNFNAPTTVAPKLTNLETLIVTDLGTALTTLQAADVSALTTINTANSTNPFPLTVNGLVGVVAAGMANTASGLTLGFTAAATVGTKDTIDLTLSNVTGGSLRVTAAAANGVEGVNVASNGPAANTLTAIQQDTGTTLGTLNVSGTAPLTITNALPASVLVANAGASTGGVTVDLSATPGNVVVTGGSGNDVVVLGTNYTGTDNLNGGAGTDAIVLTSAAANVAVDQQNVLNFETLTIGDALVNGVTATRFGAITTVNLRRGFGAPATLSVTSGSVVTMGAINLSVDSTANATISVAGSGTTDTVTTVLSDHDTSGNLTLSGVETLTLVSGPRTDGTAADGGGNVIGGLLTMNPTIGTGTINVGGSANLTITGAVTAGTLNASGFNMMLTMSTGAVGPIQIVGGSGNDTLVGSTSADLLTGGAGNDTLQGRGGNDLLTGGPGMDTFLMGFVDRPDTITDFAPPVDLFRWTTPLLSINAAVTTPNFQTGNPATALLANTTVFELVDPPVQSQTADSVVQALGAAAQTPDTDANILFVIYTVGGGAAIWNWQNTDLNVDPDELFLVANLQAVAQGSLSPINFPVP